RLRTGHDQPSYTRFDFISVPGPAVWYDTLRPKGKSVSSTEVSEAYWKLSDGGRSVVSGESLARHLGVSPAYLWERHLPVWEQCQKGRNDYRRAQAQVRQDELDALVRLACDKAVSEGYFPTLYRIRQHLVLPSRYGGREADRAIKKCFKELFSSARKA
ncbi:hypothetical protein, partial [Cupriavidus sp. amp6]|uniref:hypothetical protein n=1 Tax=Cupriavidus sp. amp6 TaxID=388051 RepID=UPI001E2A77B8